MTIAKVQEDIAHKVNTGILIVEDQLLLTAGGTEVSPDELALTKANTNCKLYLVEKFGEQIYSKIKTSNKELSTFLEQDPNSFSPNFDKKLMKELRRIAIFCVQTQLERTQNLLMIEKALKNRENIRGCKTDSDMRNEMMQMEELYTKFGNHRATLDGLVKYQEKLDKIDKEVASELGDYPSLGDIKKSAHDFYDRIETYFRQYRMYCNDNGLQNLKPTSDSDLKKMQESLIAEIQQWIEIPRTEDVTYTLKNVQGRIWSFLKTQQSILTDLEDNIQVLLLRGGESYYRRVKHLLQESERFQDRVIERGEKKLEMICNLGNRGNHPGGYSTESTSSISSIALENCIDILLD